MRLNDTLTLARLRADVQAHRVRPIRLRSGLTQAEMATEIEVSPSAIAQWEADAACPAVKPRCVTPPCSRNSRTLTAAPGRRPPKTGPKRPNPPYAKGGPPAKRDRLRNTLSPQPRTPMMLTIYQPAGGTLFGAATG